MKKANNKLDNSLKKLAKTSIIVLVALLLSKVFTYLYRIIIARYFGPEFYGLFSLAFMIIGFFVAFFSFGISEGLLRFISLYKGKEEINKIKYIFKFSIILLFFSSIVSALILFFIAEFISLSIFHNPNLTVFLKFFSILVPLWIFSNLFLATIRAYEKIAWHSFILNILDNGVKLLFLIIFIFIGIKTNAIIFSFILGFLAMFIVSYFVLKYSISEIFEKGSLTKSLKNRIRSDLFSYSWPLLFLSFLYLIFTWIDTFVIGYFQGAVEVGFYNAAIPIALLLNFAPDIFMQLFFPLITREFARKNMKLIKELSKQIGKWIFIINLPIFLIFLLFPGTIINFLFGPQYLVAENALRFLSIGVFLSATARVSHYLISMKGKSKILLFNVIIISIVNIILNIILVPKYGISGAAFATMISYILLNLFLIIEAKKYTSIIPLKNKMIKIFLLTIPFVGIVLFLKSLFKINILVSILLIFLFFFSYIILLLTMNCLDRNDFMILKTIKHRLGYK